VEGSDPWDDAFGKIPWSGETLTAVFEDRSVSGGEGLIWGYVT
jgi:hypothetical protein